MSATIAKNLLSVSKTLTAAAAALAAAAADLQKAPVVAAAPAWSEEQKKKLTKFKEAFMALDMNEEEARAAAIKKLGEKPAGNSGSAVEAAIDQPKKRGRPAGSGKKNVDDAVPSPVAKPKGKMALRMITKEDIRNNSYTLGQFTAHLREDHGLLPDSEQYLALKKKFLDTRQKLKAEVEKEMAEEQDVSDDEALVGEYTLEDDEPEEIVAAPRSRATAPTGDDWEQGF